jgi:WD repeat-containing protein 19
VKLLDLSDEVTEMEDEGMTLTEEEGDLQHIAWTRDGQVLTVASSSGTVYNFLACLPPLAAASGTNYMYLTSLLELSVCSAMPNAPAESSRKVRIAMEPTLAALGPTHVAVGMNNHVFFHSIAKPDCPLVGEREYVGTVDQVLLNADFVAVRSEGRIALHALGQTDGGANHTFPPNDQEADVSCMAMSKDFLIYGTARGTITYIFLPDRVPISEYRHETGIARLFANEVATRLVFLDAAASAFVYNPVLDQPLPIPRFPAAAIRVMWDPADWGVLVVHDPKALSVYIYSPHQVNDGAVVRALGQTKLPAGLTPILAYNGAVLCQADNGAITHVTLSTHDAIIKVSAAPRSQPLPSRPSPPHQPPLSPHPPSTPPPPTHTVPSPPMHKRPDSPPFLIPFPPSPRCPPRAVREPKRCANASTRTWSCSASRAHGRWQSSSTNPSST